MTKTATIKARVSQDTIVQIDGIVANSPGDRSDHIRQAIAEYIARHQANSSAPVAHLSTLSETAQERPEQSLSVRGLPPIHQQTEIAPGASDPV